VNDTDSLSGSLHAEFAAGHQITATEVTVERFETIAQRLELRGACVKVDVEGAEYAFLEGAGDSLDGVDYLIMEVLGDACARGFVSAMMRRGRFHAYYINDYSLEHSLDGSFTYRAPEYNWLFCRETPDELRQKIGQSALSVRAEASPR
jgi:methyltransferase FkbM-like protein